MSTIERIVCDIKGCGKDADHKEKIISVRFVTEQNEGRYVEPYVTGQRLDMCKEHYQQYMHRLPLVGVGAMGFNEYTFDGDEDESK